MKEIIIVGSGIAGLSFAYECLLRGYKVLIIDKDSQIGGLSKSITHNNCQLDMGVHIFHGRDQEVLQKVRNIVAPNKLVKVKRRGKLYIKGKYIDWPLKLNSIFQLPLSLALKIFFNQILNKKTTSFNPINFQDELLQIYGSNLYYSFFHPITKKFLKTDPKKIHSDWAYANIRAATKIEDKSFSESYKYLTENTSIESKKEFNVMKFLIKSITTKKKNEPFYYFKNGFGTLPESYSEKILKLGGLIKTNTTIETFIIAQDKINQCIINGKKYDTDEVIWTGNLIDLCDLLNIEFPQLFYIHSKFVYFFLNNCNKNHQVCYYSDEDVSFVRGTILSNHSKTVINNNKISDLLCVEYTFKSKEEMVNNFKIKNIAIKDIKKVGLIDENSSIEDIFELNIPYTYPILETDYKKKLTYIQNQVKKIENLQTFGRQGGFSYENADIIIKQAINHPMFK